MTTDVGVSHNWTGAPPRPLLGGAGRTLGVMPNKDGPTSGTMTTAKHLALNRELFAERSRLKRRERKLTTQGDEGKSPALEKELEKTRKLLERVTGKIIEANRGLVVELVSRFTKKATPDKRDEYMAAGLAGLIEAIDSYDAERDNFAAWAKWPVKRAVLDAVHQVEHHTMGDRDFDKRPAVLAALAQLEQGASGATPSIEDIADLAGASPAQVGRILSALSAQGFGKTWGKRRSAKPSVDEFANSPVNPVLADAGWSNRLAELLQDSELDMQGLLVFIERNLIPEQFGGSESYRDIGLRLGVSGETARKAELRVRKVIESKGWNVPEDLED